MMRRFGQLLTALVAAVATLALLAGVPAALVTWVGWPLPTSWPTLGELARVVEVGVSDVAIIKTLAVIVWVAWAQLALALAVETVAVVRQRTARALPLLPGLQPLAAQLVAAMLLAVVTTQPRAEVAAAPLELALASGPATISTPAAPADHRQNGASREPAAATPATATVSTGERASWWQLAEDHLGDGLRWREIRDLNLDRTVGNGTRITSTTEHLGPGWQLLVPADTTPGSSPAGDHTVDDDRGQPPAGEQRPESDRTAEAWTVEPGDHFWAIAETSLAESWGRTPTDAETTDYWQELVETNRDRLAPPHDPDLIYPGQEFELPAVPDDPAADTGPDAEHDEADAELEEPGEPAASPEPPVEPAPSDEPASDESDTHRPDAPTHPGVDEPTVDHDPADTPPTRPTPGAGVGPDPGASSAAHASQDADPTVEETSTAWGVPAGLTAGLAGSTLLAAGIMALLRRRRRAALQQRTAGLRLPTPAPETVEHIAGIEAAEPPQRRLDELIALLESIPDDVHPVLVTTQDDGTVTLLFDDDTTPGPPPAPWQQHDEDLDGPLRWTATLGSWGTTRSIGLPLLVTLGRTEQTTVLANLHAMRQLTVDGPKHEVRRRLRAYALEAATSRIAGPVHVAVTGDERLASLKEIRLTDDPAGEIAATLAEHDQQIMLDDRLPRLLVCHNGVAPPAVPDELDVLVGLARAGPHDDDGWHLDVADTRGWLQLPAGTTVELTLPATDPDVIDDELTRLDTDGDPRMADTTPPTAPKVEPSSNGHPPPATVKPVEPAWCEIRLLGPVEVVRDGQVITDDITPLCLKVLAYLATHRNGVTGEQLENAVWAGRAAQAGSQRVRGVLSRLRHALGDGPDGKPLVPPRQAGSTTHIRLSEHLGCDLDRAFSHLATAGDLDPGQRMSELTAALDLVRGEPFEGLPVSWATDVQQRAITQLQDAAAEVTAALREAGEYEQAEDSVRRGLQLCDPAEPLYVEWAHLEAARGRRDQIPRLWQRLRNRYAQDADETAGWVATPTSETELAFQTLMSPT